MVYYICQMCMEHTVQGNVSHNATCSTQCDNKYKLWFWTYISYYIFSFTQYEIVWQQYSRLKCLAMHNAYSSTCYVLKKYSIQYYEHSLCEIFNHTNTSFTYDLISDLFSYVISVFSLSLIRVRVCLHESGHRSQRMTWEFLTVIGKMF